MTPDLSRLFISDPRPPRLMFTDDAGQDYDILDMIAALRSIRANTAPNAISLSPKLRIKAIYEISSGALPDA